MIHGKKEKKRGRRRNEGLVGVQTVYFNFQVEHNLGANDMDNLPWLLTLARC